MTRRTKAQIELEKTINAAVSRGIQGYSIPIFNISKISKVRLLLATSMQRPTVATSMQRSPVP